MSSQVVITLEDLRVGSSFTKSGRPFRVKKLVNTVDFTIKEYLSQEQVQDLINLSNTKVVVVEFKR